MPLLANLMALVGAKIVGLMAIFQGTMIALRIQGVMFVAGIYIACMLAFSNFVQQWLASAFSTSFGMLLGLLFPPIAGTVMGSLAVYWVCVIGTRYFASLTKAAIK